MDVERGDFIWDDGKEESNIAKHGLDFTAAAQVFKDPDRRVFTDSRHSLK